MFCNYRINIYICTIIAIKMGVISSKIADRNRQKNVVDVKSIHGKLTKEEKNILLSGDGFVNVPEEELKFQRIDVYPFLM